MYLKNGTKKRKKRNKIKNGVHFYKYELVNYHNNIDRCGHLISDCRYNYYDIIIMNNVIIGLNNFNDTQLIGYN